MTQLRLGVAGFGRGFMLMRPTLADPRLKIVAGADPRPEARARFAAEFGARVHETLASLCRDPDVDAIYLATPHQFHAAHAIEAAAAGKHLLIEKPMAVTLAECAAMIDAAKRAGVHIVIGHSHGFDAPIAAACRLIAGGTVGRLRLVTALNFTDFLYRPRRPEELDTAQGGGVAFSQAAHQIDVVRTLAGGMARSVRAAAGRWDPGRPTEGAYAAFVDFEDGIAATLTYSGYGHFDSDELCGWIAESGRPKNPDDYGAARRLLQGARDPDDEAALKNRTVYGGADEPKAAAGERWHQHFGMVIASCERADLRPLPRGVMIYGDAERRFEPLPPPGIPRAEVVDELYDAAVNGRAPAHSGAWGMATLEVCLALLRSAAEGTEIRLAHQVKFRAA